MELLGIYKYINTILILDIPNLIHKSRLSYANILYNLIYFHENNFRILRNKYAWFKGLIIFI